MSLSVSYNAIIYPGGCFLLQRSIAGGLNSPGLLLIIGLAKFAVLPLLGIDLIMVTIAFSMLEPLWDMRIVLPRLVLLIFLFLTSTYFDYLSLDHLIFFKGNVPFSFS